MIIFNVPSLNNYCYFKELNWNVPRREADNARPRYFCPYRDEHHATSGLPAKRYTPGPFSRPVSARTSESARLLAVYRVSGTIPENNK